MGGIDKGLQAFHGEPLAAHALKRLAPQVGQAMLNANRHPDAYAALGVPVWPDEVPEYAGPLAGFLAGLTHCDTRYLVTVPCDSPRFPLDLVRRLAQTLESAGARIAIASTHEADGRRAHPVFCLMETGLKASLLEYVRSGRRKVDDWTAQAGRIEVSFDDASAFANANTLDDLQRLL